MALMGLVADYASSDEEEENSSLEEKLNVKEANRESTNFFDSVPDTLPTEKKTKKCKKSKKEKLINPMKGLINASNTGFLPSPFQGDETNSVFYNPFHKEQEAKKLMLEKHVKLSENPKDVVEINGKKICFNYRKGRCKFGHNCKFAHDSDLKVDPAAVPSNTDSPAATQYNNTGSTAHFAEEQEELKARKRKPGLGDGLTPNKRSRNNFKSQQGKEKPWLAKR